MSANPHIAAVIASEVCPAHTRVVTGDSALAHRVMTYLLPLTTAAVYLLFPTKNYYWDGISFASSIENSPGLSKALLHPHHLLYNVFGYVLYWLAQTAGLHIRAVHVLQFSNCILSAVCALLLFQFLSRVLGSLYVSGLITCVFSFSATWWKYSTDADSYIPSVLFLLVCLKLLFSSEQLRVFWIALAHTASMCLHQLAVFFYPVVVAGILLRRDRYTLRERLLLVLQYSATAFCATIAINYYCFHWATGSFGLTAFARWLTSYIQGPDRYSFSFDVLNNLRYTLRGQVRLLFEGRLKWIQGLVSLPLIILIAILSILVLTLALKLIKATPRIRLHLPRAPVIEERFKPLVGICSIWIISYLAFLFFWYPYFTPYRLFYLAPLTCLCAVFLLQRNRLASRNRRANAAMFVAAMAISNFVFFILPLTHSEKYPPLSFALRMNQKWPSGTVIYYANSTADSQLVQYFNPSTEWRSLGIDRERLEDVLTDTYRNHKTAWFETSAIDQMKSNADGAAWLSGHTRSDCREALLNGKFRIEFVQIFPSASVKANSNYSSVAYLNENTVK